jgi:hypothetical protein
LADRWEPRSLPVISNSRVIIIGMSIYENRVITD